jgi:exonuclease III
LLKKGFLDFLEDQRPDLLLLQEVKQGGEVVQQLRRLQDEEQMVLQAHE